MLDVTCAWNYNWGRCFDHVAACLWMWKKMGRKRPGDEDTTPTVNRINRTLTGWLLHLRRCGYCDLHDSWEKGWELEAILEFEHKILSDRVPSVAGTAGMAGQDTECPVGELHPLPTLADTVA